MVGSNCAAVEFEHGEISSMVALRPESKRPLTRHLTRLRFPFPLQLRILGS